MLFGVHAQVSWRDEGGQCGSTEEGGKALPEKRRMKTTKSTQNGLRKSCPNIGKPYQIKDNKAAPSAPPQGGGASRRPLGVLVVTHLVRISDVFAPFSETVLAPGIISSPAGRGKFYNPG